jgi:hypothetical protein
MKERELAVDFESTQPGLDAFTAKLVEALGSDQ